MEKGLSVQFALPYCSTDNTVDHGLILAYSPSEHYMRLALDTVYFGTFGNVLDKGQHKRHAERLPDTSPDIVWSATDADIHKTCSTPRSGVKLKEE